MANQDTQKPSVRFQGFSGEWIKKKLKNLTEKDFTNGVFNDPDKVGSGYRLINVKDMFSGSSIDIDRLSLIDIDRKEFLKSKVEFGDIFFTRSSLVKEGIAYSNVNLSTHQELTFDGHLIRMQPCRKSAVPIFLSYALKTVNSRRQFILGGKTTTMTTIGQSDIAEVKVAIPSTKEQTQIGTFFKKLDRMIELHQRKQNKLVTLKQAMLQKMFPQEGASTPEIRFKGFAGEWQENTLGQVISITSAARVHKEEWTKAGVPFFRSSDVVSEYKGVSNTKAFISHDLYEALSAKVGRIQKGDLLVTGGGSIGIPYLVNNDNPLYFKDADLLWFKIRNALDSRFLYTFLSSVNFQKYLKNISHIGTIAHYTVEQANDTPITFPCKEEQQKIGTYFRKLDNLIAQHNTQLQKLKQIKSACLEKMFV
ncbi:restriction endonuclease subunit S [Endozoicomonas montiporae]|uniref:Type I site-specific deoxyribonuclease specificity subunit n=1 Tax=Endozoicomonas montiporae CL-33 TaxID=570277 RepID=A0A142BAR0_9GAMM|nr:restriction endonuclease subunit S [Endozoicomonas montiporae]AMO55836.1 type I site-specific deoxyribonuclease specificity subunit [Endozoicomonas montiporae CL-33]